MDESYDIKLNEVCRVCLSKVDKMLNIMEKNERNSNIISMLSSIGHFEILFNDFLPKYLCKECENQLALSYNFQKILQKNNEYLMKYFDEKFVNKTKNSDYRLVITEVEIPKEEPPDLDNQESEVPMNNGYDERFELYEFVDNENRMIIDDNNEDNTTDPLKITSMSSESEEEENSSTLPTIGGEPPDEELIESLLPTKSKERYKRFYAQFIEWCEEKKIETYSEKCVLTFFQSLNSRSLWSKYSMLRSCLLLYKKVDISKYKILQYYLTKESRKLQPKKSKSFTDEQIDKFIDKAPDKTYLMMKVALIIGICGACRRVELFKMTTNDMTFKPDLITIKLPNISQFVINKKKYIDLILKYYSLRPKMMGHNRFFVTYRNGMCFSVPVGINFLGKIPYEIAKYLKLEYPKDYTGHCFRSSSLKKIGQK